MSKKNTPSREHGADGHDFRVVGVDVSKKHLDAHELPGGARRGSRTPARASGNSGPGCAPGSGGWCTSRPGPTTWPWSGRWRRGFRCRG